MNHLSSISPLGVPLGVATTFALFAVPGSVTADPPARPDLAALRARGPAGLEALLARYDHATPTEREVLAADVDAVAGQRYAPGPRAGAAACRPRWCSMPGAARSSPSSTTPAPPISARHPTSSPR